MVQIAERLKRQPRAMEKANTKIDGSKKKQRLDELESQIEKLGDKYEPKEEETVEKIDGAVQENTSTQEPQTQEPTDAAQ